MVSLRIACGCLLLLAPVFAGCRGGTGPSADAPIRVGVGADRFLTELPSRPDLGKYPLNTGIFDTLVRMTESLDIEPMLAERWTYARDTNTWQFILRRGVLFHDGRELTADDVKYTFDLIVASYPHNYEELGPGSVRVVDPYTIELRPEKPNARLAEQIAHPIWGVNARGSDPLKPIGTGPFRFVEYAQHNRMVVDRFDGYWNRARTPQAGRLAFRFVPDPQARLLALQAGQLDLVSDVPPQVLDALRDNAALTVIRSAVGTFDALAFNIHGAEPYDIGRDPTLRQAVGLAIDRRALVHAAWHDAADPSTTWIPPQVLGPHRSLVAGPTYDPAGARQLLDRSGWRPGPDGIRTRQGRRLSLAHVVTFPTVDHQEAAEVVQQQLKGVGIETRIELMPDAAVSGARRRSGQFDLMHLTGNQNEPYPCFLPDLQYYSKSAAPSNRWVAPGGRTDAAIEACRSAADIGEARLRAAEVIHQLVDVERVVVPLAGLRRIWAARAVVQGFVAHPSDTNQRWEGVHLVR